MYVQIDLTLIKTSDYPLTDPAAKPVINHFWKNKKSAKQGSLVIPIPQINNPNLQYTVPENSPKQLE